MAKANINLMAVALDDVLAAVEESTFGLANAGFCLVCGEEATGCEPDARWYPCEGCEARAVFGAEECLLMGVGQEG